MFFKDVEGEGAIIAQNGVYKQVGVATRNGRLFLKTGGGYIGVMSDGSTTKAGVRLDAMSWDGALYKSKLGHVRTEKIEGCKTLMGMEAHKLLDSAGEG